jgi:hypothetical protein
LIDKEDACSKNLKSLLARAKNIIRGKSNFFTAKKLKLFAFGKLILKGFKF